MSAFGPFEHRPAIAVAVSGGPDSLALTLLLDRWLRDRDGTLIGFTVDHGLRPDSGDEALQVGRWLGARGIVHQVLAWTEDKPGAGIQAAARRARYRLLAAACGALGVLHLAVAHHADDQAETLLFRRDRGSGPHGLAGMAAERSLGDVRLIRPLLPWRKANLIATCGAFHQEYLTDPSNQADWYARTGLRRRLENDACERQALLAMGAASAAQRIAGAEALNAALGALAEIRPDGVASLDRRGLEGCAPSLRLEAIAATLRTVGGGQYGPATTAVARLDCAMQSNAFRGAALAGCVVRPWSGRFLFCREPGRVAPPVSMAPSGWRRWDRRFVVRFAESVENPAGYSVGALGVRDFARLRRLCPTALPAAAGAGLPALRLAGRVVAAPTLNWRESGAPKVEARFAPPCSLSSERFTVVYAGPGIMFVRGCGGRLP